MHAKESIQVLLVDDEPAALEVLVISLEIAGFEVESATDGEAALQSVRVHKPQVVVTDVQMPVMGGSELARRIRDEFGGEAPTIIAATGDPAAAERLQADDHFIAVFRKPVDVGRLIRLIRVCLAVRSRMTGR